MKTVNTAITAEAKKLAKAWSYRIEKCFLDEIYDQSTECLGCDVAYYDHDFDDCDDFETELGDYFNQDCFDELGDQLVALYEATKHLPFTELPKQNMPWAEVMEFDDWLDADLDEVWTWLQAWEDAHKK